MSISFFLVLYLKKLTIISGRTSIKKDLVSIDRIKPIDYHYEAALSVLSFFVETKRNATSNEFQAAFCLVISS